MISYTIQRLNHETNAYEAVEVRGEPVGDYLAVRLDGMAFVIDHRPTGARVAACGSLGAAMLIARTIADHADWSEADIEKLKASAPEVVGRLTRAVNHGDAETMLVALAELLKQEAA